jgi:cytochrome c
MSTMKRAFRVSAGLAIPAIAALSFGAFAADSVTKDEAVAMVKKAVAAIKSDGAEKAYAEINNPTGPFVDRDLYIVVYGLDGMVLAHGAKKERIGTNQGSGRQSLRQRACRSRQAKPELLAVL